jgi:hypothetical protein
MDETRNYPTPRKRFLLEKLRVPQLIKNSLHFMEPEGSLPCSQKLAIYSYPEPGQSSNSCTPVLIIEDQF